MPEASESGDPAELEEATRVVTPEEWEQAADETATQLTELVAALEVRFDSSPERRSYRLTWTELRELQEQVRTAPAIKSDVKIALQLRLRQFSDRIRAEQKVARREAAVVRTELRAALDLILEGVREIDSVSEAHERRADLAVLRTRIERTGATLERNTRQQLWQEWQVANQSAWESLTRQWQVNEERLRAMLTEAEERIQSGDSHSARERIRAFHAAIAEQEASHRGARELRQEAGRLWQAADELAQKKHSAYLQHAGRRVQQWRQAQARNARSRSEIETEVADLQRRSESAPTDVGAALLRGRLVERRKALLDLEAEDRRLQSQIHAAETALSRA